MDNKLYFVTGNFNLNCLGFNKNLGFEGFTFQFLFMFVFHSYDTN